MQAFLDTYCVKCHGADKQKGDRRFDNVKIDLTKASTGEALQEVLDQLNLGEMPPEKSKQPSDADLAVAVEWLTRSLAKPRRAVLLEPSTTTKS